MQSRAAVSYTHLDVYKRQPQEVAAFVNGILGTFVRTEFPDTPAKPEKSDSAGEEE